MSVARTHDWAPGRRKVSDEQIAVALTEHAGNTEQAARSLGISARTVYLYRVRSGYRSPDRIGNAGPARTTPRTKASQRIALTITAETVARIERLRDLNDDESISSLVRRALSCLERHDPMGSAG